MSSRTILCVDDDPTILATLQTQLLRYFPDYAIDLVQSGAEALKLIDERLAQGTEIPLVIADQIMPGMNGDEFFIKLYQQHPSILQVMLIEQASVEDEVRGISLDHLYRFLTKPWHKIDLKLTITEALRRYEHGQTLVQYQAELERIQRELETLNGDLERQVQKRTQQLQQSALELSDIFAAMDDVVLILDRQGTILTVLSIHSPYLDQPSEKLIGKSPQDLFKDNHANLFLSCIQQVLTTQRSQDCEYQLDERFGLRWFHAQCSLLSAETVLWVARDITDRKRTEQALHDSEAILRKAEEIAHVGNWKLDLATKQVYWSEEVYRIHGLNPKSLIMGKGDTIQHVHPDDHEIYRHEILAKVAAGEEFACDLRIFHADGSVRFIETRGEAIVTDQNQLIGFRGTIQDITDRKHLELELLESQAKLSTVLESTLAGIMKLRLYPDLSFEYDYISPHCATIFGYHDNEWLPNLDFWRSRIHPDDWQEVVLPLLETISALRGEETYTLEYRFQRKEGFFCWILEKCWVEWCAVGHYWNITTVEMDITDRKRVEQALQESEARLLTLSEVSPANIYILVRRTDGTFYFEHMSQAIETIHEISIDEVLNNANILLDCIHSEDRAAYDAAVLQSLETQSSFSHEWRVITPKGTVKWLQGNSCPRLRDNGEIAWYGVVLDITDRKQAEAALRESEERWSLAIEGSHDGIWDYHMSDNNHFLSPQYLNIVGYDYEEINSFDQWFSYIHPDDQPLVQQNFQAYFDHQTPIYACEYRLRCRDGHYKWMFSKGKAIWDDETGTPIRIVGSLTDITHRRQAELALQQLNNELEQRVEQRTQELAQSEQDLRTIFNNVYDAILIHDLNGTILDANDRALELRGATREQLVGASIQSLSAPDAPLEQLPEILQRVQAGETLRFEWREKRFDNHYCFDVEVSLRQATLGNCPVFIAGVRDISDRKQYEAQLQQTNEELLRATRLKDEFLATMSHELRTPLSAILGMTESLQDEIYGEVTPAQLRALQLIESSGNHLLELINDVLDVAKIEAGQFELDYATTPVQPLCQAALSFVQQQASRKRIQIDLDLASNLPNLYVDGRRIRQVFINLLNNAVKFTPEGGHIDMKVRYAPRLLPPESSSTLPQAFLRISIADTGIGIAPENLSKLFQPFVQIDSALNRQYEGTGLGLALVKRLVELHGGQVSVTSQLGVGSCFTIHLPCPIITVSPIAEDTSDHQPDDGIPASVNPLIVLAEDNDANINALISYLEPQNYDVQVAKTGQDAIALIQSQKPDLIIMDIQMPQMNGLDAIRIIRRDPELMHIPIIALTALAMDCDRDRCLAAGASDYLSKPVKLKQLVTMIQQWLTPN